jgi:ActR/RegA family two-component response regulator
MERNNWAHPSAPILSRAPSALQLVTPQSSTDPQSGSIIDSRVSDSTIKNVLFVDPSTELQRTVQNVLKTVASVQVASTFEDACSSLISSPPDVLVTSVRLHAHNGLHLVYLAARNPRTRSIVHLTTADLALARDVEAAKAFVVQEPWLVVAIESLVVATLPRSDRRNARTLDRRRQSRGGRRCTDALPYYARNLTTFRNSRLSDGRRVMSPSHH